MRELEWRTIVSGINADIAGIVRAQRTLHEINVELARRANEPIEEDFIFADAIGRDQALPRIVDVGGVSIQIRTLHRRGLKQSDIKGADLLYEIAGRKFALVQYKMERRGRVTHEQQQLRDLIDACPNSCPPHASDFVYTCGAWFAMRSTTGESAYLPACLAGELFGDSVSRDMKRFSPGIAVFNTYAGSDRSAPKDFSTLARYSSSFSSNLTYPPGMSI